MRWYICYITCIYVCWHIVRAFCIDLYLLGLLPKRQKDCLIDNDDDNDDDILYFGIYWSFGGSGVCPLLHMSFKELSLSLMGRLARPRPFFGIV
jgi:hypothetical protein